MWFWHTVNALYSGGSICNTVGAVTNYDTLYSAAQLLSVLLMHFVKYPQLKLENCFKDLFPSQTVQSQKHLHTGNNDNDAGPWRNRQHISINSQ